MPKEQYSKVEFWRTLNAILFSLVSTRMGDQIRIPLVVILFSFSALQAHFFEKLPFGDLNCKMVTIKKKFSRQKPKKVKGRTLHDILHVAKKKVKGEDTS